MKIISMLLLAAVFTAGAVAQTDSPATLRQEISRLEQENESLQAELRDLRARYDRLEAEMQTLRSELTGQAAAPAPDDRPPPAEARDDAQTGSRGASPRQRRAAIPDDPMASPASLFLALMLDYRDALRNPDAGEGAETIEALSADAYFDLARGWVAAARDEYQGQVQWLTRIRLIEPELAREPFETVITILDPRSLEPIGDRFRMPIPAKVYGRIHDVVSRRVQQKEGEAATPPEMWQLRGKFQALPEFAPNRPEPGPFNYPPLVGPYVAFGFRLDITAATPVSEQEWREQQADRPGTEGEPVDR